tara:strand:- start:153 stop:392 length:240 start_codon:yes stop_codon:yes gene_type:complete
MLYFVNNMHAVPKKTTILGTGVAAMTSAFYLTDQPTWKEKYEITVYQMGWRAEVKPQVAVMLNMNSVLKNTACISVWFL